MKLAPRLTQRTSRPENGGRARGSIREDSGQALVEFAFLLPVLLIILTGIFTFGMTFNNYTQMTEATATAARQLAISRGQYFDPCQNTATVFYSAAPSLTQSKVSFAFNLNGNTYNGSSCNSASTSTGAAGNLVQGQPATLTVTYPCSLVVYGKNLAPGCVLTTSTTEVVQ